MSNFNLTGKIAVVTGGDSGMGQAIAEEFAKNGADVLVTYLHDRAGAEETCRRIEQAGRRGVASHTDQRDAGAVAKLFEEVEAKLGVPYILVNNAGLGGGDSDVADTDIADWDNIIRTNLYGPFYCCQQFIRLRKRAGEPWEVAQLALYLASDDSDYVTGQSFTIDGGLEMNWGQGA